MCVLQGSEAEAALLARVPHAYRAPLPPELADALRRAATCGRTRGSVSGGGLSGSVEVWPSDGLSRVAAHLAGLLEHGTDARGGYGPRQGLRDMLGCLDFFDADGEDRWFWASFPAALEMRHVVAAYQLVAAV